MLALRRYNLIRIAHTHTHLDEIDIILVIGYMINCLVVYVGKDRNVKKKNFEAPLCSVIHKAINSCLEKDFYVCVHLLLIPTFIILCFGGIKNSLYIMLDIKVNRLCDIEARIQIYTRIYTDAYIHTHIQKPRQANKLKHRCTNIHKNTNTHNMNK